MQTLYSKIGSDQLRILVNTFYDLVFTESSIAHLFKTGEAGIREKQFLFLTQFLGGPALYTEQYGHPKMKIRHLPHAIGEEEKNEWLRCMQLAINKMDFDNNLAIELYNCFPKVAEHMRDK
jgi:hemoglobin